MLTRQKEDTQCIKDEKRKALDAQAQLKEAEVQARLRETELNERIAQLQEKVRRLEAAPLQHHERAQSEEFPEVKHNTNRNEAKTNVSGRSTGAFHLLCVL